MKKKKKKKNMKRWNEVTATYNTFSLHALLIAFKNALALTTLKYAYPWAWIVSFHCRFASFVDVC